MCNITYTKEQHQHLIDEAQRAVESHDPITRLNRLLFEHFNHLDERNREYVIDEFMTWYAGFGGREVN